MRRTKYFIALILILSLITIGIVPVNNIVNAATTIKLNNSTLTLGIGESYQLKVTGTKEKVTWTTNKKWLAKVNSEGLMTAVKDGYAIITATVGKIKLTCGVAISKPKFARGAYNINLDKQIDLEISYIPIEYKNTTIVWKSANSKIATVDQNGTVTGISIGVTRVTASFGEYVIKCNIAVTPSKQQLKEAKDSLKIEYGEQDNHIICLLSNSSKIDFSFNYKLVFYDENDNPVSVTNSLNGIIYSGGDLIITFNKADKEYKYYKLIIDKFYVISVPNKIDASKVEVTTDKIPFEYEYWNGSSYLKDTIEIFVLKVNNMTGQRISLNANIVYYKNGIIVGVEGFVNTFNIDIGNSVLKSLSTNLGVGKIIIPDYDNYKLIYTINYY